MILSMTGYGEAGASAANFDFNVEIKSVNNKHLNVKVSVPDMLNSREREIEQRVRDRIARGSVNVFIKVRARTDKPKYRFNADVVKGYLQNLGELADAMDTLNTHVSTAQLHEPRVQDLLNLPGVLEEIGESVDLDTVMGALLPLVDTAVDGLIAMRGAEGKHLGEHVASIQKDTRRLVDVIEKRSPVVVEEYREKLKKRLNALLQDTQLRLDDDSLLREVAIFADRADICEEIARLRAHIDQVDKTLAGDASKGRKLDFISQEMLREANTIGSKANDRDVAQAVVELKTCIEQLKEQVQNIE